MPDRAPRADEADRGAPDGFPPGLPVEGEKPGDRVVVFLQDMTGHRQRRARLAADVPVHALLPPLVTALALPMLDSAGGTVTYQMAVDGRPIDDQDTLATAGVTDYSVLDVAPVVRRALKGFDHLESLLTLTRGGDFAELSRHATELDLVKRLRSVLAVPEHEELVRMMLRYLQGATGEPGGPGGPGGPFLPGGPGGGEGGAHPREPSSLILTISIDTRGNRRISAEGALVFHSQDNVQVAWVDDWIAWPSRTVAPLNGYRGRPDAAGAEALLGKLFSDGRRFHHDVFESDQLAAHQFGLALGALAAFSPDHEDRLILRFSGPRHHLAAPFELLRHPDRGFLSAHYPLVRRVDGIPRTDDGCDRLFDRPVNALFVASASRASAAEEALRAVDALMEAAGTARRDVVPTVVGPDEATLEAVQNAIERCDAEVVHIASDAEFDPANPDESGLLFPLRAGDGGFHRLTAQNLGGLLAVGSKPRLLFASAPGSAATGSGEQLARVDYLGVLDAAVHAGVPAAVGYRWTPSDEVSVTVAEQFYRALAETGSVPRAACRARQKALQRSGRDPSWAGLVVICQ
jgi:hypothetical protein